MKYTRGFTLIEVMVALVIVATALPALMMLITSQLQSASFTREKTQAYWIAENQMTRLRLRHRIIKHNKLPQTASGKVERSGVSWYWELNTQDTDVKGFKRLDVRVALSDRKDETIATLSGFMDEQ